MAQALYKPAPLFVLSVFGGQCLGWLGPPSGKFPVEQISPFTVSEQHSYFIMLSKHKKTLSLVFLKGSK